MSTGNVIRVAGVGLNVSDLNRSADFYTKLLGLKEIMRVPPSEATREIVLSLSGDIADTLVVLAKLDEEPLDSGRATFGRVIMNTDDAVEVAARVQAAGYAVERLAGSGPEGPIVYFVRDPDGYQVELFQR